MDTVLYCTVYTIHYTVYCTVGEVDFWIFNFLQFAIDGKNNCKTKVEKVFFFCFMSSYAEISFFKSLNRVKKLKNTIFLGSP
jgi:hypothetical protein